MACGAIFGICVEIDLTQWAESVSAGTEVGLLSKLKFHEPRNS